MTQAFDVGSGEPAKIDGITLVPRRSRNRLGERALEDYGEHRVRLIRWMRNLGKDPEKGVGYAFYTTRDRASRLDQFYRWVWDEEGHYATAVTHDHADAYMLTVARNERLSDKRYLLSGNALFR